MTQDYSKQNVADVIEFITGCPVNPEFRLYINIFKPSDEKPMSVSDQIKGLSEMGVTMYWDKDENNITATGSEDTLWNQ
tara:strand:- start:273 stop:509 length:237 start_codon:yes stop_codon:yes gene_type:complete